MFNNFFSVLDKLSFDHKDPNLFFFTLVTKFDAAERKLMSFDVALHAVIEDPKRIGFLNKPGKEAFLALKELNDAVAYYKHKRMQIPGAAAFATHIKNYEREIGPASISLEQEWKRIYKAFVKTDTLKEFYQHTRVLFNLIHDEALHLTENIPALVNARVGSSHKVLHLLIHGYHISVLLGDLSGQIREHTETSQVNKARKALLDFFIKSNNWTIIQVLSSTKQIELRKLTTHIKKLRKDWSSEVKQLSQKKDPSIKQLEAINIRYSSTISNLQNDINAITAEVQGTEGRGIIPNLRFTLTQLGVPRFPPAEEVILLGEILEIVLLGNKQLSSTAGKSVVRNEIAEVINKHADTMLIAELTDVFLAHVQRILTYLNNSKDTLPKEINVQLASKLNLTKNIKNELATTLLESRKSMDALHNVLFGQQLNEPLKLLETYDSIHANINLFYNYVEALHNQQLTTALSVQFCLRISTLLGTNLAKFLEEGLILLKIWTEGEEALRKELLQIHKGLRKDIENNHPFKNQLEKMTLITRASMNEIQSELNIMSLLNKYLKQQMEAMQYSVTEFKRAQKIAA